MVRYLPQEILPGDLSGRRAVQHPDLHLPDAEGDRGARPTASTARLAARAAMLWFHNHGYGNAGATSGHLIPDYGRIIQRRLEGGARRA